MRSLPDVPHSMNTQHTHAKYRSYIYIYIYSIIVYIHHTHTDTYTHTHTYSIFYILCNVYKNGRLAGSVLFVHKEMQAPLLSFPLPRPSQWIIVFYSIYIAICIYVCVRVCAFIYTHVCTYIYFYMKDSAASI